LILPGYNFPRVLIMSLNNKSFSPAYELKYLFEWGKKMLGEFSDVTTFILASFLYLVKLDVSLRNRQVSKNIFVAFH